MKPDPRVLDALRSLRFNPRYARPALGPGERRSTTRGAGLEFIDHRPYRPGDDIRKLDMRLMARLDQPFIRQYAADLKLPVTIVFDTSASMRMGTPPKLDQARELAQLFAFLALAGGDAVRICRPFGERLDWSPRLSGLQRLDMLFAWLESANPPSAQTFGQVLARASRDLPPNGLVIMVSDWLDADAEAGLRMLREIGHEPVIVQIASPGEIDPSALGEGTMALGDAETGEEIDVILDAQTLARYRSAFESRQAELRSAATRAGGWYFFQPSAASAARLVREHIRSAGLVL